MKYSKLRTQILAIVMALSVVSMVAIQFYYFNDRQSLLYEVSTQKLLMISKALRKFERNRLSRYHAYGDYFAQDARLLLALNKQADGKAHTFLNQIYHFLKQADTEFAHLHLYDATGMLIPIVGLCAQSEHRNALSNNPVLSEAIRRKVGTSGYVPLDHDGYYFSIIDPVFEGNALVGYLEFGIEAGVLIDHVSQSGQYLYALYYDVDQQQEHSRSLGRQVASNTRIFEQIGMDQAFVYDYANLNRVFESDGRYYLLHQFDIETPYQKNFAQMLLLSDVTSHVAANRQTMLTLVVSSLILLASVFAVIWIYVNRLIARLVKDESDLEAQRDQMHAVIDHSDSLIIHYLEGRPTLANLPFLHFFNVGSLEAFELRFGALQRCFEARQGVFISHADTVDEWVSAMMQVEAKKRIVAMRHVKSGQIVYFSVRITSLGRLAGSYVVSLIDITALHEEATLDHYNARHDELTKVYNRHYFNELLLQEIKKALKEQMPLSLMIIDIDHFKRINDTWGHNTGDEVLRSFAQELSSHIRVNDILARWGGEEFVLLLSGTVLEDARKVAEHLRESVARRQYEQVGYVTCSIGISEYLFGDSVAQWIGRADMALYSAKNSGRNRVETM